MASDRNFSFKNSNGSDISDGSNPLIWATDNKEDLDYFKSVTGDEFDEDSLLPGDIYVKEIEQVPDTFHARYHVKAKEYIYVINMGEYNPIEKDYIYQYNKKLDVVEMERALKYLEGTHNFKSFTKTDDEKEDYVRTIVQTRLTRELKNVNKITLSFLGTGFMRYQVRNMIGTLIEIGEGKRKSEDIIDILNAQDRRKAGKTANPEGLYLKDVLY